MRPPTGGLPSDISLGMIAVYGVDGQPADFIRVESP